MNKVKWKVVKGTDEDYISFPLYDLFVCSVFGNKEIINQISLNDDNDDSSAFVYTT